MLDVACSRGLNGRGHRHSRRSRAAVVAEIEAAGGSASYLHQDVTSEDEWKAVATSVMEAHGRIDVLVNNAGIGIGSVLDFEL